MALDEKEQMLHTPIIGQVNIRHASDTDAYTIATFTRRIALETEKTNLDPGIVLSGVKNALMDTKHGFYAVAEYNQKIIGCLMVTYEWSDWRNGVQWWLQSVYVDSGFRRIGVFRKLFNFVRELAAQEADVCGIRLYVDQSNTKAISTYHSLGLKSTNYLMFEMPLIDEPIDPLLSAGHLNLPSGEI